MILFPHFHMTILNDICNIYDDSGTITWTHTYRETNQVTYKLTKYRLTLNSSFRIFEFSATFISNVLLADAVFVPFFLKVSTFFSEGLASLI